MTTKSADLLKKRFPEVWAFRDALSPETDRGCALMAAAYLDSQLEELLDHCFVEDGNVAKEILGQSKPLGTFSARIDMSYLLGHISAQIRKDLHLIRKIRNAFGHDPKPIDFASPPIADRCRELHHSFLNISAPPRKKFTNAAFGVLASIHAASHGMKRPLAAKNLNLSRDAKRQMLKKGEAIFSKLMKEIGDASEDD